MILSFIVGVLCVAAAYAGEEAVSGGVVRPDVVSQTPAAAASAPAHTEAKAEYDYDLNAYYTNVSVSIPLAHEQIPDFTGKDELEIYQLLFRNSLLPRFVLLEAAVFPLPLAGVGINKYTPNFYKLFNVGSGDLNLIDAVTAGFQEPYAFTIFLGNMANFVKPGEEKSASNRGYMGYMFSYSNEHIKRDVLIPDNNLESEWKLKGDRVFKGDKLNWSFRVGAKIHENPDISNTAYLGIRRSNLDFNSSLLSLLANCNIDFRWDFSLKDGRPLRQVYTIGKTIPQNTWKIAFKLDVGLIWEAPTYYTGALHDTNYQSITAIIRPNIDF